MSNGIDYKVLCERMVQHLLAEGRIKDKRVIEAMLTTPRHLFVDEEIRGHAYDDCALPIGCQQTISQPYMVAKMTELLELSGEDKVLEVGTGSGYQTAILAKTAHCVCSVERIPQLADMAGRLLKQLGLQNVKIKVGDGTCGWPEEAPFTGIIVTACTFRIPSVIVQQLTMGGRLVLPIGDKQSQRLIRLRKGEDGDQLEDHGGCVFVPLIGKHGWVN